MNLQTEKALELYKQAEETLFTKNLTTFENHTGKLLKISGIYTGVWMEHAYDALLFAKLFPNEKEVALSQAEFFLDNQRENGQLPAFMLDLTAPGNEGKAPAGYRHIQECVPFARICYETYELTQNQAFLERAYKSFCAWDAWLCSHRMTRKTGLIELFCEWDTGHDNALRLDGIAHSTKDLYGSEFEPHPALPILAPDMNAVFYGDRKALAQMARTLGKTEEAEEWEKKAKAVQSKMLELLYNKEDNFFYDLDVNGNFRKFKTIQIANVFQARVLEQDLFDRIYTQYFENEKEFKTPVPFPATSISDPAWVQNLPGNSWNFYAQTLVALRTDFWMEYYGKTADYEDLLYKWLCAFTDSPLPFGQEFHPITGAPSDCSPNYSSALLFYIQAMRRLGYC